MAETDSLIPIERIGSQIYLIRGQKVMLDSDLAELYGVPTKALNQAVSRNRERFPEDFMFRLSGDEFTDLRSQIVTSSWGGRRYPPRAFTEHGVAMLSSVLRSERAVEVSIAIIRTFVRLREILGSSEEIARRMAQHDREIGKHDQDIRILSEHVMALLTPPDPPKKPPIGFVPPDTD